MPRQGRFASIQDYLRANEAQGEQMGQQVAGEISRQAGLAGDQYNQSVRSAQKAIGDNTLTEEYRTLLEGKIRSGQPLNADEQRIVSGIQEGGTGYGGPREFASGQMAGDSASNFEAALKEAETGVGRSQILQKLQPGHQVGGLDAALLGRSRALENLQQQYGGMVGQMEKGRQSAMESAKAAEAASGQQAQKLRENIPVIAAEKKAKRDAKAQAEGPAMLPPPVQSIGYPGLQGPKPAPTNPAAQRRQNIGMAGAKPQDHRQDQPQVSSVYEPQEEQNPLRIKPPKPTSQPGRLAQRLRKQGV